MAGGGPAVAWGNKKAKGGLLDKAKAAASAMRSMGGGGSGEKKSKKKAKASKKITPVVPDMASFGMFGDLEGALYARVLAHKLEDADPRSRRWTAQALGSIGYEALTERKALEQATEDQDDGVRKAAREALLRIRGKSAEPEPNTGAGPRLRRRTTKGKRASTTGGRRSSSAGRRSSATRGSSRSASAPRGGRV